MSPYNEKMPIGATNNPYGTSKFFSKGIIKDLVKTEKRFKAISLRYFNVAGADQSGNIRELWYAT